MTLHDPSLRAALKTLKLGGMLDTPSTLAWPKTRDGQLGHLEFLQMLCERKSPAAYRPP